MALREGAYALGATKLQVSTRIVVPAALSGIVASFVLGDLARGRRDDDRRYRRRPAAELTLDPPRRSQTMTAFIAQIGLGDVPTGTIEYKTIFAVGADAVRGDAGDEPDQRSGSCASTGRSTSERRSRDAARRRRSRSSDVSGALFKGAAARLAR